MDIRSVGLLVAAIVTMGLLAPLAGHRAPLLLIALP